MATDEMEISSGEPPLKERSDRDDRGRFTKGNGHRWKPGHSGNAAGRRDALTDTLRRKLQEPHDRDRTRQEAVVDALINEAASGSVRAADLIWQRLEGRLGSTIDLNVSRSEFEKYQRMVDELQEIALTKGTPISRAKAVALIATSDPRIAVVLAGEGDDE